MVWYVSKNGKRMGPYTDAVLGKLIEGGKLHHADHVWREGLLKWTPIDEVPGLLAPPPITHQPLSQSTSKSEQITPLVTPVAERIATSSFTPQAERKRSYIVRHWRGDLSLGFSYWVNGSLLTIILLMLISWLTATTNIDLAESPKVVSAGILAFWTLLLVLTGWQFVGIWRSADKHVSRGGKRIWAILAKFAVVMGVLRTFSDSATQIAPQVSEYWTILIGQDTMGTYQLRVLRDASELEIQGPIVFGLADDVTKVLEAQPTITLVHLNSNGGRTGEAKRLSKLIESRHLSTYTSTGCFSACVDVFLAGDQRLISSNASLGFHQPSFPGMSARDLASAIEKEKKFYLSKGVPTAFVEKAFSTPSDQLWKPSHEELFAAHVITGHPTSEQVAISGFKTSDYDLLEATLLKTPLYAALKNHEPQIYQKILNEMKSSALRGQSMSELRAITLPLIEQVYMRRLPYASDVAIRAFTGLMLDEISVLYEKDPIFCYQYLFPTGNNRVNASQYFAKELNERELSIMADVINSSSTADRVLPGESQVQKQLERVMTQLSKEYGSDLAILVNPKAQNVNKAKVCKITYSLYKAIYDLPDREAIPLLQYMFANK